ncbi:LysR family transcriptional regulator, partial [Mesorhizobium sp. M1006]
DPVITRSVVLAVNPKDERSPAVSAVRKLIPKVVKTLIEGKYWAATVPNRV